MLDIYQIEQYYPENLRGFRRFILREYLQYKILEIVFNGPHANKLVFLGGTCLRIVQGNQRFSEDLDFDNLLLSESEFTEISANISVQLDRMGYETETKLVAKGAYHCYIRFPRLLFAQGLSGFEEEKILIQLDTEPQHFDYAAEKPILNKFDVFTKIAATPLPILMAQKCYAILNRPRNKGRDFFDLVFLMGRNSAPDIAYLRQKLNLETPEVLKERLLNRCLNLDMTAMAADVAPFLFNPADEKKVRLFAEYLEGYAF
jgi:predicted nucleotidyltransferase component of viral defense system